jgi:hypothetical protein
MKQIQKLLLATALSIGLMACSNASTEGAVDEAKVETDSVSGVTEISWEDLMPEGEDEVLEALYLEFYEEFERRMLQNSTPLSAAAKQDLEQDIGDVSSMIQEGSADDTMEQIGTFNVVKELDGKHIRVPGYVVPFDFNADAEHKEFLLVPYFGACLHTPPPPPNQIIFVKSEAGAKIDNIYDPVWLEGTLSTGEFLNELGNSAYELSLAKIEPYEY